MAGLTAWPTILASLLASSAPLAFLLNGRAKQVAVGGVACAALLLSFGRAGWLGLAAG